MLLKKEPSLLMMILAYLDNSDSPIAKFAVRCTKSLHDFCKGLGLNGFELADPTAMICMIWPEVMTNCIEAHATVETKRRELRTNFLRPRIRDTQLYYLYRP